jgi:hypothetical protein
MMRIPGDPSSASQGQTTMTRTVQCPECGVVLNVPESAAGRKLKCPKCATKFAAPQSFGPGDSVIAESGPGSTLFPTRKGPPSQTSGDLPTRQASSGSIDLPVSPPRPKSNSIDLPSSPGPLRDTFDLPLLDDDLPLLVDDTPKAAPAKQKAPADALALFQDEPKTNRKLTGAEARSKARRCPDCGGVVGVGMSLCNICGLDLDTGQRITLVDVFDDEIPQMPRQEMPPLGVLFVGSIAILANLLLAVISLVGWAKGDGVGFLCLLLIWIFGIYASIQFLRRKSIRLLFLSLGLAVGVSVVYLIVLPIWAINAGTEIAPFNPDAPGIAAESNDPNDPDAPAVVNLADKLEKQGLNKIVWGIAVLLSYAALSVYLNTPGIKRQFQK